MEIATAIITIVMLLIGLVIGFLALRKNIKTFNFSLTLNGISIESSFYKDSDNTDEHLE